MKSRTNRPPTTSASRTSTSGSTSASRASMSAWIALMSFSPPQQKSGPTPASRNDPTGGRESCPFVIAPQALSGDPRALLDRRGARPRAVAVDAVIAAVGTEAGGERERLASLRRTAGLHQRAAEAEERVVVRRSALDDGLELDGRLLEAA